MAQLPATEGELLALAAGDDWALSAMVWVCFAKAWGDVPLSEASAAAEAFARLASAANPLNAPLLASVLLIRADCAQEAGNGHLARLYQAEATDLFDLAESECGEAGRMAAVAALARLADNGNENAAVRLNRLLDAFSADEAARVKAGAEEIVERETRLFAALISAAQ